MSQLICRRVCIALLVLAGMASAIPAAAQADFYTVPGCRVYDSRIPSDPGPDGPLDMGTVYTVSVAGTCGVPADATAVALNVTVIGANKSGFLAVFPAGTTPPFVEMLAFKAGRTQAVLQMVGLSDDGDLSFEANPSSAPPPPPQYHFVIDVIGYYLNVPPVLTAGGVLNYTEDDPPTAIDTTITVSDADDTNLQSATVQITGNYVNGQDVLSFVNTANITGVFTAATGTLALTGSDTLANWQTALRSVLYENTSDSPSTAARTVTWIADDGADESAPVTSTINVTAHNDAPAGTDNAVSTPENTDYVFTTADFGFSDPNDVPANALLAVTITTLPGVGSLTLSGGAVSAGQSIPVADITAGNLKFTPITNANGSPYTTFTFQVQDDGGTANGGVDLDPTPNTMTINVTGVNNAPAGTDNTVSTPEDVQYTFTAADFGFTDPLDTPPNNFASVVITTLPGVGSLTLSGSGFAAGTEITVGDINAGNLKFTPVANASGSPYATFTFQVRDDGGTAGGGVDLDPTPNTMTINVTAVNDAPAGTNNTVATSEDTQYTFTVADFGFTDPNDTPANNLLAVKITTLPAAGTLTLSGSGFAAGTDISVANITAGNLKFTPAANASGSPYTTFTFQVQDDGGTAGGGVDLDPTPNTMTVNVTAVNDAPAGTNNTVVTGEDTQYTFTAADFGFTDPNDTPANNLASVVITTLPGLGSLTLSGGGFAAGTEITVADITAGNLKFAPAANGSGSPYTSFTFQVRDDGGTAGGGVDLDPTPNTMTINVTGVNDAPAGTNGSVNAFEDTQYTFTAANFGFTDPNDTPANALASVVITTLPAAGTLTLSGSGFAAGTEITVADINAGNLKFLAAANASGSPYTTFTFQVRDDGGTAGGGVDLDPSANTMTINVASVNDAPAGTDNTVTTDEDVQYIFTAADFGFTDPLDSPANNLASVVITTLPGAGSLTLSGSPFAAGTEISLANITGGNLRFLGALNAFGSPYTTFTFQVRDDGGTANGGVNLDPTPNTITVNVLPVNDAPILGDATIDYTVVGNTQLRAGEAATGASVVHIRDNSDAAEKSVPTDIDGPAPPFTYSLGTAPANGQATVNNDGTFTYEPNPGFAGPTDTFTINVSDGGAPAGVASITVTVTISEMVWYVHDVTGANNPAPGDDGRSTNAFEVLQEAINAAGPDDFVFVFRGNTGATPHAPATITNKDGLKLIGQGIGLSVPGFPGLVPAGAEPNEAVIQNAAATAGEDNALQVTINTGTIDNVEIRGFAITATDNAIDVTVTGAATAGVRISENEIGTTTAEGIDINHGSTSTTSAIAIHDNALLTAGNAIDIARTNGTLKISAFDDNVVSGNTTGSGIVVNGPNVIFDSTPATAALDAVPGGTTVIGQSGNPVGSGINNAGMHLFQVTGSLSFTDLDIYSAGYALFVEGTGAFTGTTGTSFQVTPAPPDSTGSATMVGVSGGAVDARNATIDLRLAQLTSTTSTFSTAGVNLDNVGGQFRAPSGSSITKSAGIGSAFGVLNSSANVDYAGTINATTGGGVSLTNNSGVMNFTGTLTLNTGAGSAFVATGGGTVTATDSNNVLATTTATALNVSSTLIGSGGLLFRSISANGAAKGIILNSTGTAAGNGSLSVTGTGTTDGSGGTIQNISGRGGEFITTKSLSLKNINFTNANTSDGGTCTDLSTAACNAAIHLSGVNTVTLDNINITGTTAQQAINGINVSNFTLTNSTLANCGTSGGVEEGCIKMRELTGTASITNSDLSFPGQDVVEIVNTVGPALTLNVNNTTFRDSQSSAAGGNGLQARSQGTASMVVNVTNSSFLRLRSNGLQATAINSASNDVDVTNCTFDPGTGTMIGLDLDADNTGNLVFNVQNNPTIYSRNGPAVNVFGDTNATINGRINNNPDVQVKSNVGSNVGSGIRANINKNATARIEIKNNVVNVGSDDAGIDLSAIGKTTANPGGATNTLDATVTGNNVTIGATSTYGIIILSATNAGDTNALCANVGTNSVTRNPSSIASFRARVPSASGFFRMEGFVTNPEATWNAKSNTPTSAGGSEVSFGGSGTFAACTAALPTNPGPN